MHLQWSSNRRFVLTGWQALLFTAAWLMVVMLAYVGKAQAAAGLAKLTPELPVMECAAVMNLNITDDMNMPVKINSATVVTSASAPYCEVRGTIAPANTVVLRLPTQGWTQRYLQTGCGGLCGNSNINYGKSADCTVVKDGTIASATTDMGHQGAGTPRGSWAVNNPQAQIDFAYRGVHVASRVAKAIITQFYGKRPAYSYFNGCSDGGREALMEAQRYPDDFDGIAAGAPASNMVVQNTFHHVWNVMANQDAAGSYILLAAKLPMLHDAVLKACDGLDSLVDGVIEDPRRCNFEPARLLCKANQENSTCLTAAEADVVRKLHDGARDSKGRYLEQKGSHPWGSELEWTLFVPKAQGMTTGSETIAAEFASYLAYFNVANPNWQLTDLEFSVPSFWKTVATSSYLSATDPDLGAFARRGGKLLLWHGWGDQHISTQATLNYYDALRKTMGASAVDRFARLYLFPGVAHCGGGAGPDRFDVLTPVMAWVEGSDVPNKIVASKVTDNMTTRTRPVFPYPMVARWTGAGSSDDEANFVATAPRQVQRDDFNWIGKQLYSHGYQANCQAEGSQLVCTPSNLPFGKAGQDVH
jgi:Tannase and feruloyl esterase